MAKDNTGGGSGGGKEAEVIERFKKLFRFDPKFLLSSAIQVPLRKTAEWLGKSLRKIVPNDSPWRSDITEFSLYVVAAVVESPGSAILRVIGEFIAAFTQFFCGGEGDDAALADEKLTKESLPSEVQVALTKAVADIVAYDTKLTIEAEVEHLSSMNDFLTTKEEQHRERLERLVHGPKKEPEPKEPSVPFREHLANFDATVNHALAPVVTEVGQAVANWKTYNQGLKRRNQLAAPTTKTFFGRFWDWLAK